MEKSLEGMISCLIRIYFLDFAEVTVAGSSAYALGFIAVVTLVMLLTPVFLQVNKKEMVKPEFIAKYSALYES